MQTGSLSGLTATTPRTDAAAASPSAGTPPASFADVLAASAPAEAAGGPQGAAVESEAPAGTPLPIAVEGEASAETEPAPETGRTGDPTAALLAALFPTQHHVAAQPAAGAEAGADVTSQDRVPDSGAGDTRLAQPLPSAPAQPAAGSAAIENAKRAVAGPNLSSRPTTSVPTSTTVIRTRSTAAAGEKLIGSSGQPEGPGSSDGQVGEATTAPGATAIPSSQQTPAKETGGVSLTRGAAPGVAPDTTSTSGPSAHATSPPLTGEEISDADGMPSVETEVSAAASAPAHARTIRAAQRQALDPGMGTPLANDGRQISETNTLQPAQVVNATAHIVSTNAENAAEAAPEAFLATQVPAAEAVAALNGSRQPEPTATPEPEMPVAEGENLAAQADLPEGNEQESGSREERGQSQPQQNAPVVRERHDVGISEPAFDPFSVGAEFGLDEEFAALGDATTEALNGLSDAIQDQQSPSPAESDASHPLFSARPATAAVWLHRTMSAGQHAFSIMDGWQVMDMKLEGERGGVTIKTRRDEERVTVSVNFTDPALAAQLQANAGRIEQALQAQYEAPVSLSFESSGESGAQGRQENEQQGASSGQQPSTGTDRKPASAPRPKAHGALREWIV